MFHTQEEQFSVAWMRLWISGYHLGLPLAIVHWKATVWKNSNFYWNLKKLDVVMCVPHTQTWLLVRLWRVLPRDSIYITAYVPPIWTIKWNIFGSRQVFYISNYQLVSRTQQFVPYPTVCLWSLYTEQSINYFGQKLTFFFKFNKFQPLKFLFPDFLVLYEQLLSSVPYTTVCPIPNGMFMIFVYWTIHQLLWSKIDFFLQI